MTTKSYLLATSFLAVLGTSAHAQTGGVPQQRSTLPLPTLAPITNAPRAKFEPEGDKVYHGASLPNTWDESGLRTQVGQYQGLAGKRLSIVTFFASAYEQGRQTSWRNDYLQPLRRVQHAGAVSLIKFSVQDYAYAQTHKIADLKDIALGKWDAYFKEAAGAVHDFGQPVFISINHEMNGDWYPYSQAYPGSGVTADDYVAAWKRIVDIFRKNGADNAAFVWSPNVPDVGGVPFQKYYPGDDYVDWVGASFYSGNPIEKMDSIYRVYAARKPIFITEWATGVEKSRYYQGFPGDAEWVNEFFQGLEKRYPRVKAISWFQWNKDDGNYLLQRVPEQRKVYATDIQNPRYVDRPTGLVTGSDIENPAPELPPVEAVLNEVVPVENAAPEKVATDAAPARKPRPRLNLTLAPRG